MSYAEFTDWLVYYRVEPFGAMRDDLHAALVACLIANANRDPKKRRKPFAPGEFIPDWWRERGREAEGPAHVAMLLAKMRMLSGWEDVDGELAGEPDAQPDEIGRKWR